MAEWPLSEIKRVPCSMREWSHAVSMRTTSGRCCAGASAARMAAIKRGSVAFNVGLVKIAVKIAGIEAEILYQERTAAISFAHAIIEAAALQYRDWRAARMAGLPPAPEPK